MVAVIGNTGIPLMPTNIKRARKLLKAGRAVICKHFPMFAIKLLDRETGDTQPITYGCDTGYIHVGVSVGSQKHEYASAQYDLLKNEPEHHRDRLMYRRQRRSRKRYRKPRFDNRKRPEGWFAPSIQNKLEQHILIFERYKKILPITKAVFEMGQFDTQLLKALAEGKPAPEGTDYQQGERYGTATLREAVFTRDNYSCVFCGRGIKNNAVLHVHHIGFWKEDRSNRLSNLATACEKCHTPKNHKPGGKLYGVEPKLKPFTGATFMTSVRWKMCGMLKERFADIDFYITYGAKTKQTRRELSLVKSHANDAYAIAGMFPKHRCRTAYYEKQRRNNRILEKFYDAKYIDARDKKIRKGAELFFGRTKRNKNLSGDNLHRYRQSKVSQGKRRIRKNRYPIRSGDVLTYNGNRHISKGVQNKGRCIKLANGKVVITSKVRCLWHCGGWKQTA